MNSAKKLLQFDFNAEAFAKRAPQPDAIPSERLATLEEIIKNHSGKGANPPDRESLREIYYLFIDTPRSQLSTVFKTPKRTRHLAWVLTYFEEADLPRIVDTPQLYDALKIIETPHCGSYALRGVFDALLQAWGSSAQFGVGGPHTQKQLLQKFVKKHLTGYNGAQKAIRRLKENMPWYCNPDGATELAMYLFSSQKELSDVWSVLELPDYTFGYTYFGVVAMAYVSNTNLDLHNMDVVTDIIKFVKKHNNDKTTKEVLSKLIEQLGRDASENVRQPVQSYILQKWQDPRIAGADVKWHGVSKGAREIFIRWITKEDLRFFFDVVSKACNDLKFEYRKTFWLAYLEHISFCRPVLRSNAENLFKHDAQALQYYHDRQPATLKGGNSDQHGFIIQMAGYTFVEFSTAAACYVYKDNDRPFNLGEAEYRISDFRNKKWAVNRVTHSKSENYYWQKRLEDWISDELEIKPLQSYELEG